MRDKSKISGVIVLLLAVFLLAVPSWAQSQNVAQQRKQVAENSQKRQGVDPIAKASAESQSNGDLQNDDATGKDADSNTFIDQIVIDTNQSNCKVSDDASITIEDQFGNVGVVVNNQDAIITASNQKVTVNGIPKGDDIDFFVQTGDPQPFPGPLDILASSGIVCGNKNNDGFNNKNLAHLIKKLLNQNNQGNTNNDGNGEDSVSSSDDSGSIDSENTADIASSEDTFGSSDSGAFADGAEASTPGAVASANGDEDTLGPVGPQGDVVDEVPTSGPLPNTGGISLLALAMPVLGVMLLGVALAARWKR